MTLLLLFEACHSAQAQDGPTLMQKMIGAYQKLQSYDGQARVDQTQYNNGRVAGINTYLVTLSARRPNRLLLVIHQPGHSVTRSIYSDGKTLSIYDSFKKRYSASATAPTLESILPLLRQRAHVAAELDPLYFLGNAKLPPTLIDLKAAGSKTIDGRPSFVVIGTVPAGTKIDSTHQKSPAQRSGAMHWTWYIDQKSFLLNRIDGRSDPIPLSLRSPQKGKPVPPVSLVIAFQNTISHIQVNPDLAEILFQFKKPSGAILQNPAEEQKRGGQ